MASWIKKEVREIVGNAVYLSPDSAESSLFFCLFLAISVGEIGLCGLFSGFFHGGCLVLANSWNTGWLWRCGGEYFPPGPPWSHPFFLEKGSIFCWTDDLQTQIQSRINQSDPSKSIPKSKLLVISSTTRRHDALLVFLLLLLR